MGYILQPMNYLSSILSSPGGRKKNEDYCGFMAKAPLFCYVVADGLGGHHGGQTAARMAVELILAEFNQNPQLSPEALKKLIEAAQSAILQHQEKEPRLFSMRTTVVILLIGLEGAMWSHIGDSRLYHFSGGRIVFQTKDHSVPQAMADAGDISPDEIRHHEDRNRLLRSLGNEGDLRPMVETIIHPVYPGDAFLLCTDGFWDYVTETEMEVDLACTINPEGWLKKMGSRIQECAVGDYDNYTAIAVFAVDGPIE